MKITLAFDLERSGATNEFSTIAIGAVVMDQNFNQLDSLLLKGFMPQFTRFEARCWNQFWSKHQEVLTELTYEGDLSFDQRQLEMITEFQQFRSKWEQTCESNGDTLILVSDNCVYDGGFINDMIFTYLPGTLPIPYSASKQDYEIFHETFSMQRGLLKVVDPSFTSDWGLSQRISELYNLPPKRDLNPHNPVDDAYEIAYDYQVLNGIQNNQIHMKSSV